MSAAATGSPRLTVRDVDGWELSAEVFALPDSGTACCVVVTIEIPGEDTFMNVEITPEQWAQLIALPVPGV